jgi:hypothetical protein
MTEDGYLNWQPTNPKTLTFTGIRELQSLTDPERKYTRYYDGILGDPKADNLLLGTLSGSMLGGAARVFLPVMKGDGGSLCMAMMLVGAGVGYYFGERANRNWTEPPKQTYLEHEKGEYQSYLGRAYGTNTFLGGIGLLAAGSALNYMLPESRVASIMMTAGVGTAILGPFIGNPVGQYVAGRRMEHKRALSQHLLDEWNSSHANAK